MIATNEDKTNHCGIRLLQDTNGRTVEYGVNFQEQGKVAH